MELDSGSAVAVMGEDEFRYYFPKLKINKTYIRLKSYSNHLLQVIGCVNVDVGFKGQHRWLLLYVVSGKKQPLFGLQWIRAFSENVVNFIQENIQICAVSHHKSKDRLANLITKYDKIFKNVEGEMKVKPIKLQFKTTPKPKFFAARSVPFAIKTAVEDELLEWEGKGILRKVDTSEFATPIVPIMKQNGKIRICGDYKITLNPQLHIDEYPLPTTNVLLNKLAGGDKFSKIDLKNAYLQWPVEADDQKYLTINTHRGLFQVTRLMFGLNFAPTKFQKLIESILSGIPGIQVFIDDIRITAPNDSEHLKLLEVVFKRLLEFNIQVNVEKCEFMKEEIEYCGYKLDKYGVHKSPSKMEAVLQAPRPKNKTELQSFLGLINYYHRFFENLGTKLEPLHKLLRSGNKWVWDKNCENSFNALKREMASDKILVHYSPKLPLILATDASPIGVGAVISHKMPDGSEKPIQFASQTLNTCQRKWSQIDREAYAIIFGVKKFFDYLYGREFTLFTDNRPLTHILAPEKCLPVLSATRMQHYAVFLQGLNYKIKYRSSKENANADAFSRLPVISKDKPWLEEADVVEINQINQLPITFFELRDQTERDEELAILLLALKYGKQITPSQRFNLNLEEFSLQDGVIMRGARVVVPKILRKKVLNDLHECHFGSSRMKALGRSFCWWPGFDSDIEEISKNCTECCKRLKNPPTGNHHWEQPSHPFERVHVDFAGPYRGVYFFILVDAFSKWPEVHILKNITTNNTIKILRQIFAMFGLPRVLVSDNGTQFTSSEFKNFLKLNGIIHKRSAPYHPATNGLAERFVQTLKEKLGTLKDNGDELQFNVVQILAKYRLTPHTVTRKSPSEIIFRHPLVFKGTQMIPKRSYNWQSREFELGDRVVARNYFNNEKWKSGVIESKQGSAHYKIRLDEDERLWRRHEDQNRKVGEGVRITEPEILPLPIEEEGSSEIKETVNKARISNEGNPGEEEIKPVPSLQLAPRVEPNSVRKGSRVRRPPQRLNL